MAHTTSSRITLHAYTKGVRVYNGHARAIRSDIARRQENRIDEIQAIANRNAFDADKVREGVE